KRGYRRVKQQLLLGAGRDRELSIVLAVKGPEHVRAPAAPTPPGPAASATGGLVVRAGVAGARYRLGDSIVGSGKTLRMDAVPVGTYKLVVSAPGRRTSAREVTIQAKRTLEVTVRMRRRRGARRGGSRGKRSASSKNSNDPDQTLNPFRKK
ncbi:MAG: PEGA domain-containing protein, partial [Myxococcales bacterium]|nr:PEGA domain-containing protein [Myxococcales bacterium]